ncbi:hypothetical protein QTP86_032532, partial [Hemibagrus guttatus]
MATEGDRQSVLRKAKVRTALKGDSSWIQRASQSEPVEEEEDEKPWVAEVRASRLNSDFSDPAADDTPPKRDPQLSPSTDGSKTAGYLVRGVFTKTDTKPTASSTNGYIGTSGYTKKASDGYKKMHIANEAFGLVFVNGFSRVILRAPHTVRTSVEKADPSEPSLSTEEKERRTEAASKILDSSAKKQRSYVLSAAKKYEPTPGKDNSDTPASAFIAKRVVISDDDDTGSTMVSLRKQSNTLNALSDTLLSTPESTSKKQVTSPVPETQNVSKPKPSSTTSVNEKITQATSIAPVATLKSSATTEPKPDPTPKPSINPKPVEKTGALNDNDLLDLSGSTPQNLVDPIPTSTDLLSGDSLPKTKKTTGSLDLLAVDIIPIDTNTDKLSTDKTNTKIVNTQTVKQTKKDVKSSLPQTKKTSESLDLLAYDVIPIDTNKDKLSTDKTQSTVKTVTSVVQTKTTEKGSAEPFDPIPIVKESTKSPVELFDPLLSDRSSKSSSPWDRWAVPTIDSAIEDSPASTEERELDTEAKKNLVYIKSYMNSDPSGYGTSRYDSDYVTSSTSSYAYSSPSRTADMTACTYCGSLVGNDSKITIDHLNISCHPECFKCGVCSKPMGDFIHSMFLHRGTV